MNKSVSLKLSKLTLSMHLWNFKMETVHRELVDPGPIDGSVLYMQSTHRSSRIWEGQVGILYDEISLQNVLDMIADWTMEERQMLRNKPFSNHIGPRQLESIG
ncbi:hypothetical protein F0562_027087 [Nyssa sinensis]|uniref:Uncharacterized protein n=1 Tax=Nyssa sinensis TaxID=561372 RepID=A0A5J5B421_9ASTE|nr:hypothetical protein F0562_027087 [Nyssa sinensis]